MIKLWLHFFMWSKQRCEWFKWAISSI